MVYQERRTRRGDDDKEDDNDTAAPGENRRETQVSSGQMAKTRARISPTAATAEEEGGRGGESDVRRAAARASVGRSAPASFPPSSVRPRAPLPPRSFDRRRPRRSLLAALELFVIKHRRKEERGEGTLAVSSAYISGCVSVQVKCQNIARLVSLGGEECSLSTKTPLSTEEITLGGRPWPGDAINQSVLPRTRSVNQTQTRPRPPPAQGAAKATRKVRQAGPRSVGQTVQAWDGGNSFARKSPERLKRMEEVSEEN